jgi:hypothetical protein
MLDGSRSQQRRTYMREGLLLAGFLLIVIAGIVTVAVPELSKTPDDDRPAANSGGAVSDATPSPLTK